MPGIVKSYGAIHANRGASLEVERGEIHAVVGENGAGKSTLMRVLAGLTTPDAGTVVVDGRDVTGWSAAEAIAAGVGLVQQHAMLVPTLTIAENIVLGREPTLALTIDRARVAVEIRRAADRFGVSVDPERRAGDLSVGEAHRVDVLKVLWRGARILVLDEPTAALSPVEVERLWPSLRALRDGGDTVILVTHKLDEVMFISERVTVLRGGRTVATLATSETSPAELAAAMVGRADASVSVASTRERRTPDDSPTPVLRVHDLFVRGDRRRFDVEGVSFDVRGGEILGIAGVEGSGQRALLDAIAGLRLPEAGSVHLDSRDLARLDAREHVDAGISYIPDDRQRYGLVMDMTVSENLVLGTTSRFARRSRGELLLPLDRGAVDAFARQQISDFAIHPSDPALPVRSLSGGNQQKVLAARALGRSFRLLLAAQPTRGVDVGSIQLIHARLLKARDSGAAVLLVSSELNEVLALADRVGVMFRGRLVALVQRERVDLAVLGALMTGAAHEDASVA